MSISNLTSQNDYQLYCSKVEPNKEVVTGVYDVPSGKFIFDCTTFSGSLLFVPDATITLTTGGDFKCIVNLPGLKRTNNIFLQFQRQTTPLTNPTAADSITCSVYLSNDDVFEFALFYPLGYPQGLTPPNPFPQTLNLTRPFKVMYFIC